MTVMMVVMMMVVMVIMMENIPTTDNLIFRLMNIQISHVAGVEPTAERMVSCPVIILGCQDRGTSWQR